MVSTQTFNELFMSPGRIEEERNTPRLCDSVCVCVCVCVTVCVRERQCMPECDCMPVGMYACVCL